MWKKIILLFLLFQVVKSSTYCPTGTEYCFTITPPDNELQEDQQYVNFKLVAPKDVGWVGIGIGNGMISAYLIVAWPNKDGTVTLSQRQATSYSELKLTENQNDLILDSNMTTTSNSDGKLEIHFKRLIKVTTNTIPNKGDFIWAISDSPVDSSDPGATIKVHSKKDVISMNLVEVETSSTLTRYDKLIIAHAIIMFTAWGIAVPGAIFIARFARNSLPKSWFHLHWSIQVFLTTPLVIVAGILSSLAVKGFRLDDPHKIIGSILFIGLFIQLTIGAIHHKLFDPNRQYVPWWTRLHWWFGRILVVLSIFQIPLGLSLYGARMEFFYAYYIYIFILLIAFSFMSIRLWNQNHSVKEASGFRRMTTDDN
ncbi:hypothetical protein Glove_467g17 [Diversispora epigaea]|uniref:DOMON domain-containing protein n=1 Tax=Diversispora epigaea TaxID=1348612 RepID=A0A397GNU9_9GLOM|nr:hypothetical protein Glove_467g17 [Diversispora epigaea]